MTKYNKEKRVIIITSIISLILFILLSPGFIFSIPANDNDTNKSKNEVFGYAGFKYWRQTLTSAIILIFLFLILTIIFI
mgnify:CR=1 FL=1